MRLLTALLVPVALVLAALPALSSPGPPEEGVQERFYDRHGRLTVERGVVAGADGLAFERHYWHTPVDRAAKPDSPGNGNGNGGGGGDDGDDTSPGTDCSSDKYRLAGWRWTRPYSATASAYASVFHTAGSTWAAATAGAPFGGISAGSAGVAGQQDFHNQIDFVLLSSTSTIAVTTTWYYTATGEAVESDARYNTHFDWATDESADAMDVEAIAAHELGHTFGLDHPNGNPRQISCLTMYAYGSTGSTSERTLGDGDILGIRALYG